MLLFKFSAFISTWLAKKQGIICLSSVGVAMTQLVHSWYSDNSALLEDPGVYLRRGVY